MSETKDSVKIRHLIEQAERLPKQDCIVVLKAVMATVAEEDGDWTQTLRMAIEEVEERVIADNSITTKQIAAQLNITDRTVQRHVAVMQKKGVLKREGTNKGKWVVVS